MTERTDEINVLLVNPSDVSRQILVPILSKVL